VRVPVLVVLLCTAAVYESRTLTALGDFDIWWHLRTGGWILEHRAVPHTGLFSQYSDRPWIAYSWGFEVAAATVYRALGLRAIPALLMSLKVLLALVTFVLARGSRHSFWSATALGALAQYASPALNARPAFLSMLFFGVELIVLFRSQSTGDLRPLFWLPALFALWANVHVQFIYGLVALELYCLLALAEEGCRRLGVRWFGEDALARPPGTVVVLMSSCALATLLTPYFYHPYETALRYAQSTATYSYIIEMHAMNFRLPEHYVRLALALAAVFLLGRRGSRSVFPLTLLTSFAFLGFHAQRDAWCLVMPSIAVIADGSTKDRAARGRPRVAWENGLAAVLAGLVLVGAAIAYVPSGQDALLRKVEDTFPVRACNFIRDKGLPSPLYNPLNWGGFLIYYLPDYPVAMDGRTDLYGDEIVTRQHRVLDGEQAPWDEPTLVNARTLLLHKYSWLGGALAHSPRYQQVYSDDRAVVFVRPE
jgi:hypothetical protein